MNEVVGASEANAAAIVQPIVTPIFVPIPIQLDDTQRVILLISFPRLMIIEDLLGLRQFQIGNGGWPLCDRYATD